MKNRSNFLVYLCIHVALPFLGALVSSGEELPTSADESKADQIIKMLAARERKLDPFGLGIDPKTAATLQIEAPALEIEAERPKTSLQEALDMLMVTGVIPRRHMVIIGPRTLRVGDQFAIEKDTMVFRLNYQRSH